MRRLFIIVLIGLLARSGLSAEPPPRVAFETKGAFSTRSPIDAAVYSGLKKQGLKPANRCSDAVFLRRVYLDVTGTLPLPQEVLAFLKDRRSGKRTRLIDDLLLSDGFADYWTLKWCDILRVKAEFPINLWPNAVQAYHRWIHDSLRNNVPYDQFARELITASGSNFRVAPVNFYRALQTKKPEDLAQVVALAFMGVRTEKWDEKRLEEFGACFALVGFKPTREWKEEVIYFDRMKAAQPDAPKTAVPATKTSAPAAAALPIVSVLIPPSTSR